MSRNMVVGKQITCDLCGSRIFERNLQRHRTSKTCSGKAQADTVMRNVSERMRTLNYVAMRHPAHKQTLERAGVPMEQAPTFAAYYGCGQVTVSEGWWIPDWAAAIVGAVNAIGYNDENYGKTKRPSTAKRVAILKICMKDVEFRDSLHAVLMLVGNTSGRDALDRAFQEYKLQGNHIELEEEPLVANEVED